MKNPLEITQDVLDSMIGIGGLPSAEEFYEEFDFRLKEALGLTLVDFTAEDMEEAYIDGFLTDVHLFDINDYK